MPFVLVAAIAGLGAFYGGMAFAKTKAGALGRRGGDIQSARGAGLPGGAGFVRRGGDGGFASGEILAKDSASITVKLRDGGTKIVFFSDATEIGKFTSGAAADLEVGKAVTVVGKANADGSIAAQTIQLRPEESSGQRR